MDEQVFSSNGLSQCILDMSCVLMHFTDVGPRIDFRVCRIRVLMCGLPWSGFFFFLLSVEIIYVHKSYILLGYVQATETLLGCVLVLLFCGIVYHSMASVTVLCWVNLCIIMLYQYAKHLSRILLFRAVASSISSHSSAKTKVFIIAAFCLVRVFISISLCP